MPVYLSPDDLRRWPHLAARIASARAVSAGGEVDQPAEGGALHVWRHVQRKWADQSAEEEAVTVRRRRGMRRRRGPLERWLWRVLIGGPLATAALVVVSTAFGLYIWPRTQVHAVPATVTGASAAVSPASVSSAGGAAQAPLAEPVVTSSTVTSSRHWSAVSPAAGAGTEPVSSSATVAAGAPAETSQAGVTATSTDAAPASATTGSSVTIPAPTPSSTVASSVPTLPTSPADGGSGTGAGPVDTAAYAPGGPLGPQCTPETVMSLPLGEIHDVDTCAMDAHFLAADVNADRCASGASWDAMACPDNNTGLPPQWAVAQQWLDFALAGNSISRSYELRCAMLRGVPPYQCAAVPPSFSLEEFLHPNVHVCRQTPCTIPYK